VAPVMIGMAAIALLKRQSRPAAQPARATTS
jgi:hypothetical protein